VKNRQATFGRPVLFPGHQESVVSAPTSGVAFTQDRLVIPLLCWLLTGVWQDFQAGLARQRAGVGLALTTGAIPGALAPCLVRLPSTFDPATAGFEQIRLR
tara:strand:- start:2034 stop:2336 length:303 start_codon:yes stop_codon:yes gene_type:complete